MAGEVGANGKVTAPLPLLGWVDYAVGLVEVLVGSGPDVFVGPLLVVEAGDVSTVDVDHPGIAVSHPLGDYLGHTRTLLDPHRCCRPEVPHLGGLAETRHGIGGEREQTVDGVLDLGVAEHVHQLNGRLHLVIEVVRGERHLRRR